MKKIFLFIVLFTIGIFAQNEIIDGTLKYGLAKTSIANLAGRTTFAWTDTCVFKDSLYDDPDPSYTFTNVDDGEYITLYIYINGTSGITFPSGILWQGTTNIAPTTLQADSYNIFKFWKAGWIVFGINVGGFKYP